MEFPPEVDIPSRLSLGCPAAMMIAKQSSRPGSQSSHTLIFLFRFVIIGAYIFIDDDKL